MPWQAPGEAIAVWSKFKLAALLAVVGLGALVPLYGDPRRAAVTHPEWARMLLRALQMDDAVQYAASASQAFSVLSWKNTLSFPADRYLRGAGVKIVEEDGERRVAAAEAEGEVAYPLTVLRGGDYRLRVHMRGNPAAPATAEIFELGEKAPVRTFSLVPASLTGWVDGGVTHLDRGPHTTVLRLPAGTAVERLEVAPPCVDAIEPVGGWRADAITLAEDVAVTSVKALDREAELPPAATPIEVGAGSFTPESNAVSLAATGPAAGLEGLWLRAGAGGQRAVVFIELPDPGLYTISVFGSEGAGQSWLADACRKAVVCKPADPVAAQEPQWKVLMTAPFSAGRHFFTVVLREGAAVQRLRAERKKETPEDYVAALRRIGFDVGPSGPIPRAKAVDAMRFLQRRAKELMSPVCGDVVVPQTLVAGTVGLEQGAPVPGPQTVPPESGVAPPIVVPLPGVTPEPPPVPATLSTGPPVPTDPPPTAPPPTTPTVPGPTPTPTLPPPSLPPPSDPPAPTLVMPPSPSPSPIP
jgi:hypothetical protein